jgi:hypothetical protein
MLRTFDVRFIIILPISRHARDACLCLERLLLTGDLYRHRVDSIYLLASLREEIEPMRVRKGE